MYPEIDRRHQTVWQTITAQVLSAANLGCGDKPIHVEEETTLKPMTDSNKSCKNRHSPPLLYAPTKYGIRKVQPVPRSLSQPPPQWTSNIVLSLIRRLQTLEQKCLYWAFPYECTHYLYISMWTFLIIVMHLPVHTRYTTAEWYIRCWCLLRWGQLNDTPLLSVT